jgi:hypothetical protein
VANEAEISPSFWSTITFSKCHGGRLAKRGLETGEKEIKREQYREGKKREKKRKKKTRSKYVIVERSRERKWARNPKKSKSCCMLVKFQ